MNFTKFVISCLIKEAGALASNLDLIFLTNLSVVFLIVSFLVSNSPAYEPRKNVILSISTFNPLLNADILPGKFKAAN